MRSVRYCLLDEVDRYPASAGSEGDPVNLAVTRTANFWNRKIVLCSTPTVKGTSRIEAAWLESNQQTYWVPCPHCGAHQVLRWANVEWPESAPEKAQYRCEHCSQMIGEHQKAWMLKHGEWRAARPDREIVGFWINSLYSPWRKWRDLAKKFLVDKKSPETLREFVNTVLAEPWDDEAQTSVDLMELMARREHYRAPVPAGAAILTCGVDVRPTASNWNWLAGAAAKNPGASSTASFPATRPARRCGPNLTSTSSVSGGMRRGYYCRYRRAPSTAATSLRLSTTSAAPVTTGASSR